PACAAGARSRRRSSSSGRAPCGSSPRGTGTSRGRSTAGAPGPDAPRTRPSPPTAAATSPRPPAGRTARPRPPPRGSLRLLRLLLHAEHGGDVIEDSVHERGRVFAPEAPRDLDRLVDGDRRRDLRSREQLVGAEAQQRKV